ncbi:hypothetical protein CRE_14464 [Caenorhabditis remanei]|nr:hypothetical protein CRE_24179 [Caenorhabditis remanei]EFO96325.1 hypothetical protein CRE_14464 [Caenorhabditis remanei]
MFRMAGRRILNTDPEYRSASDRLIDYNLQTLKDRREHFDVKFFQKLLLGKIAIDHNNYFSYSPTKTRRGHSYRWKKSKTKISRLFFTNRVLNKVVNQSSRKNTDSDIS